MPDEPVQKRLARIQAELARIPQEALDDFITLQQRHSYAARLDAHHATRNILARGVSCAKVYLVVLSGRDKTDSSGKVTLLLDELLCGVQFENTNGYPLVLIREPPFLATAISTAPVFATVRASSTPEVPFAGSLLKDRDGNTIEPAYISSVTVDIMTWKSDGNPAPNTNVSWICTVEAAIAVNIGG